MTSNFYFYCVEIVHYINIVTGFLVKILKTYPEKKSILTFTHQPVTLFIAISYKLKNKVFSSKLPAFMS